MCKIVFENFEKLINGWEGGLFSTQEDCISNLLITKIQYFLSLYVLLSIKAYQIAVIFFLIRNALFITTKELHNKLLRSHIHEYGHVRNRHVMFINDRIYKEQESQKHVTTSCSGTKPFY